MLYIQFVHTKIYFPSGASLVSIEDTNEAKFIENYISFLGNENGRFSIGLFKTYEGNTICIFILLLTKIDLVAETCMFKALTLCWFCVCV